LRRDLGRAPGYSPLPGAGLELRALPVGVDGLELASDRFCAGPTVVLLHMADYDVGSLAARDR
jgi:hypothetical protein